MKLAIASLAAVSVLVVPIAAFAAGTPSTNAVAASLCKQEQAKIDVATFAATYGTNADKSNAFGKCVSKNARTAQHDVNNAAKACKTEQANPTGTTQARNAYGKCVSAKVKSATAQQASKAASAARSCRADLEADRAAFATTWGTGSNAFGTCVSSKSKSP